MTEVLPSFLCCLTFSEISVSGVAGRKEHPRQIIGSGHIDGIDLRTTRLMKSCGILRIS